MVIVVPFRVSVTSRTQWHVITSLVIAPARTDGKAKPVMKTLMNAYSTVLDSMKTVPTLMVDINVHVTMAISTTHL